MFTSVIYGQMESGYVVSMDEFPHAIVVRLFIFTGTALLLLPTPLPALFED